MAFALLSSANILSYKAIRVDESSSGMSTLIYVRLMSFLLTNVFEQDELLLFWKIYYFTHLNDFQ